MYIYFKILAPFLIFNITCKIRNAKSKRMGIKAGYMKKLPGTSPFNSKTKLRCTPQPGQSICVNDLKIQGIWWDSSQVVIFKKTVESKNYEL
jgi:hypothetical protein